MSRFVGWILSALFGEKAGFLPNFHTAIYRIGTNPQDLVANRSTFVGKDVEPCYDTRQVFQESYPHGTHSVLSPWHVKGRYLQQPKPGFWASLFGGLLGSAVSAPSVAPVRVVRDPVAIRAAQVARTLPASERIAFMRAALSSSNQFIQGSGLVLPDGVR